MCAEIEELDLYYPLHPRREKGYRGIGLAVVNHFNEFPRCKRQGSDNDLETLAGLFSSLNLEFRHHTGLTKDKIVKLLEKMAKDPALSSDSMIMIVISSHGCEEGLLGINIEDRLRNSDDPNYKNMDDCIPHTQIQEIFNGENCKGLVGKPKLLLLNGCRGKGLEHIVKKETEEVEETLSSDSIGSPPDSEKHISTTWSDFFVIHSSVPGNISIRSNIQGSLLLVEFSKAYAKCGHRCLIESIMPTVNRNLMNSCKKLNAKSIQCCTWESTCTQLLFIPPKTVPNQKIGPTHPHANLEGLSQPPILPKSHKLCLSDSKHTRASTNPMSTPSGVVATNPMSTPRGVVTAQSGETFVTDPANECIWVFPNDGTWNVLDIPSNKISIPNHGLAGCWGVCIRNDFLFVSCDNRILKISSSSRQLLKSQLIGTSITGLDIDDNGMIYACERYTCKILVLDIDLNIAEHKLDLSHRISPAKDRLLDIKVFPDSIYVLISGSESTIQMFDKKGRHIIHIVSGYLLKESYFFTMDRENRNIFVGDVATNELKAFCGETYELLWKKIVFDEDACDLNKIRGMYLNINNEVVIACIYNTELMVRRFTV